MNQDIYNRLRDRIIYLEAPPGTILKEQVLAKEFGVSRTPLRTVLFRLEWEHLVKILPRTGIQVSELEINTITNVFQARLELEGVIGTMAAERFTRPLMNRMDEFQARCDALVDHKDPRALADLDMEIKQIFHEAAGNPFLIEMSERLYLLTFRLWYFTMLKMDHTAWNLEVGSVQNDLTDLSRLLKENRPDQVGRARKDHLVSHLERIRSRFLGIGV